MTHIVTQEQLWAQFDQLDPQQREEVTALIESFLAEDVSSRRRRDKQKLLALSTWGEEDLAHYLSPRRSPMLPLLYFRTCAEKTG